MSTEEVVAVLEEEAKDAAIEAAEAAVEELQGDGLDKDDAIEIVFNILDAILAFKEIGAALAGPAGAAGGAIAEEISDEMLEKAEERVRALRRDPEAIEARADAAEEKGRKGKAKRLRKAAARVRARQAK